MALGALAGGGGAVVATARILLRADNSQLKGDFNRELGQAQKAGSHIGKAFKVGFAVAVGAAGGLALALKKSVDAAVESQKVSAQTEAVLRSTGGAAGVTAKQIEQLAGALQKKTTFDDETIRSGQNLLLTFTNIRNETGKGNDIFNQTTRLMLDMSQALGQDTKSSAIQLGKALNDPIKGVTALQRVGVSFTKEQRDQIKTLVESGRTLDAQKLILAELTKEFGGSAEAAGNTFAGKLEIAKNAVGEIQEKIGNLLLPVLTKIIGKFSDWITRLSESDKVQKILKKSVELVGDAFKFVFGLVGKAISKIAEWVGKLRDSETVQNAVRKAIDLLGQAFRFAWERLKDLADLVQRVVGYFRDNEGATKALTAGLAAATAAVVTYTTVTKAVELATKAWAVAQRLLNLAMKGNPFILIVSLIAGVVSALVVAYKESETFRRIVDKAFGAVKKAVEVVWDVFKKVFGWIKDHWKLLAAIIGGPIAAVILFRDKIVDAFNFVKDKVGSAIGSVRDHVTDGFRWVKDKAGDAADFLRGIPGRLGNLGSRIGNAIKSGLGAARDWIKQHIVDKVVGFITGIPGRIGDIGRTIGDAIAGAVKKAWNAVANFINDVTDFTINLPDWIPGLPDEVRINFPDLPTFQRGGTVPQPPGSVYGQDSVLAMLAPGEVVVPVPTVEAMGGDFWRQLGIPGFADGGKVKPRYGTWWLRNLFQSPADDGTYTYQPGPKKRGKRKQIVEVPDGTPHVGPAGDRMRGHPLEFPFWQMWWGPGEGDGFSREWAKRNRKGPSKFAEWAKAHPLAARLLGVNAARLAKLEHWPWYRPPHPAGPPVADIDTAPPLGGTDAQRYKNVQRAVRYANYIAGLGQPYTKYGGHGGWDYNGPFDCSGFVSSVLHFGLGMLSSPLSTYGLIPGSGGLVGGAGKWVTVFTRNVAGDPWSSHTVLRLLGGLYESGGVRGTSGGPTSRSVAGFTASHPPGYQQGGLVRGLLGRIPRFAKGGRVVNRRFPGSLVSPRKPNPPRGPKQVKWGDVASLQKRIDRKQKQIERADRSYENMARRFDVSVEEFIVVDDEGNESLDQTAVDQRTGELRKLIDQKDRVVELMEQLKKLLADMVQLLADLRKHYRKKVADWKANLAKATDPAVKAALQKKIDDAQEKLGKIKEELPTARENRAGYPDEIESVRLDKLELQNELDEVLGTKITPAEPAESFGDDLGGGGGDLTDPGGGDLAGGDATVSDTADAGGTGDQGVSPEEVQAQIAEALQRQADAIFQARSAFLTEFASNIFRSTPAGFVFGTRDNPYADSVDISSTAVEGQGVAADQVGTLGQLGAEYQAQRSLGARAAAADRGLFGRRRPLNARNHPAFGDYYGGGSGVSVIHIEQNFQRPPTDQFANLERARFAAETVLGS